MKAPWRYRLGRCKRCLIYFVLKANPSKTPYLRGMHCEKCRNRASADASGKSKRAKRENELLELAVQAYAAWHLSFRKDRNQWVAEKVSELRGKKREIQRNWVTRHEKDIVAELKRRSKSSKDTQLRDVETAT
jgi:hypothetical protein